MKKLLILLFSILISFNSYGEWKKITSSVDDDIYYLDYDSIRVTGGYVHWWDMIDIATITSTGAQSVKAYHQGDCDIFRIKHLNIIFHDQPMGKGNRDSFTPTEEWNYPPPNSASSQILKEVCNFKN